MATRREITLAFDVYGTLLSTESIATKLASHFGEEKAASIAQQWRCYQLEYTWRLNSMNKYEPFSSVTRKSCIHALGEASVTLKAAEIDDLMAAYNSLNVFADVPPLFEHLARNPHINACVFSNGTNEMVSTSLAQSPDLSPYAHLFGKTVVVEPIRRFKPDPKVYAHLCAEVGRVGSENEVWLVSGNPFDIVGAKAVGISTCWVDRSGKGWVDRLGDGEGDSGKPDVVVKGLDEVVGKIGNFVNAKK